jgi:phage repressor protein C with HTH and peptisase S24 domain
MIFGAAVKSTGFTERLREWVASVGSQSKAARISGVSQTQISDLLNNGGNPSMKTLTALADTTGKPVEFWVSGTLPEGPDSSPVSGLMVAIPILSATASAGGGSYNGDEESVGQLSFDRSDPVFAGRTIKHLHLIRVQGDSMEPTIHDGRLVMIDTSKRRHGQDGIYAIRSGAGEEAEARIKRLRYGTNAGVEIISDNSIYPVERVPDRNEIALIGRAIWTEKLL